MPHSKPLYIEQVFTLFAGILGGDDFEIVYEANAGLASFRYAPPPPIRSYGQDSPMCPLVDEEEKVLSFIPFNMITGLHIWS